MKQELMVFLAGIFFIPLMISGWVLLGLGQYRYLPRVLALVHAITLCLGSTYFIYNYAGASMFAPIEVSYGAFFHFEEWTWNSVFLIDALSLAYLGLITLIYPVIVRFSRAAMVREPNESRYWLLVTAFAAGATVVALSGSVDVLYLGWEIVGVCSVMLIAFFEKSVRSQWNSLLALSYYRLGDFFLLAAAIEIHHALPEANFSHFAGNATYPMATYVSYALLFATLAKAAQLPLSPWLHRAMEGPAASSGVFYGALSVHLGPFLLLRSAPLWMAHSPVRWVMGFIGCLTAVYATMVGRTRADAKTGLAYAVMTQIGLIFVEIALGFHVFAMIHIFAHAGLRTWQFLRSSSLIQDFQYNPLFREGVARAQKSGLEQYLPRKINQKLYLMAQRQFWLDGLQTRWVIAPLTKLHKLMLGHEDKMLFAGCFIFCITWMSYAWGVSQYFILSVFVLMSVLYSCLAVTHESPFKIVIGISLSQAALIIAGFFSGEVGEFGAKLYVFSWLSGLLVLGFITFGLKNHYRIHKLAPNNGLAAICPGLGRIVLAAGWIWVGLPGGVSFFAEDMLFHAFLEESTVATLLFLAASGLNVIAFYRMYTGLFGGVNPRESELRQKKQPSFTYVAGALVTYAAYLAGIFPNLFFGGR